MKCLGVRTRYGDHTALLSPLLTAKRGSSGKGHPEETGRPTYAAEFGEHTLAPRDFWKRDAFYHPRGGSTARGSRALRRAPGYAYVAAFISCQRMPGSLPVDRNLPGRKRDRILPINIIGRCEKEALLERMGPPRRRGLRAVEPFGILGCLFRIETPPRPTPRRRSSRRAIGMPFASARWAFIRR